MSGTILAVDDNPVNLKLAAAVLRHEGHHVLCAGDAEEARRLLARLVPDLILMDLAMPGMDGLALTRLLKADPRLQHVPVIAVTAFSMKGDDDKAREAGCDGYITKPIDTRTLPGLIEQFLQLAASRIPGPAAGNPAN